MGSMSSNTNSRKGNIGFLFHIGHGHYTQFLNFQECFPAEHAARAEWIALHGDKSGDKFADLPFLSGKTRYSRHQNWHAKTGIARRSEWDALFFASFQVGFLPFLLRHRSYFYIDLTPSLKKELSPWYDHQATGGIKQAIQTTLSPHIYSKFRGIFTMSEWSAAGVRGDYHIPAKRVHVAHPGANLNRWHFQDRSDRLENRPVRILMVGGQFKLKGGEFLLDWAKKTKLTNWEMDIVTWVGELPDDIQDKMGRPDPGAPAFAALIPDLPNVRIHCGLTANTPQMMQLFEDADIFCLPTQADGSSIASLEAMAAGLPVAVSAVGGIPELIDDGKTGLLMKRSDPADIAVKLEELITNRALRLSIGKAARKSCEDYYNVSRQLDTILSVIDKDGR